MRSVLVVGVNIRPVIKSARALGIQTIAVDCFNDVDLAAYADELYSVKASEPKELRRPSLFELALRALEAHEVDAILLGSGTEHYPKRVKELERWAEVLGNKRAQLQACKDKLKLFRVASKLGIRCPRTKRVRGLNQALRAAERIGYPVVLKPAFGGGGMGIRLARSPEELERGFARVLRAGDRRTAYVQEFVKGADISASILSDGTRARCLTVNEQIIGARQLGCPRRFGYCGNVVPLRVMPRVKAEIAESAEALCSELGLVGSNGVDFVLAKEPYLMEVNPRFQGTLDCVEGVLGINLVEEHLRACWGELREPPKPRGYSIKLILYSKARVRVPDLRKTKGLVDIPQPGSRVEPGKPLCSVLRFGKNVKKLLAEAHQIATDVYRHLKA